MADEIAAEKEIKKIEKLTPEQEALIPVVRDEWLKIGLSTEPVNREAAVAALKEVYRASNLEPPPDDQIYWFRSPWEGCIAAAQLTRDEKVDVQNPSKEAEADAPNQAYKCGYGLHDAGWLAFYDFFSRIGLELPKLEALKELSKNCGWWWPFDGGAVLTERPAEIHRDEQNRLHNPDGMALRYHDNWGFYVWHGLRVPEDLILNPDSYTAEKIINEPNAELRRAMVERVGMERLLKGAKEVDATTPEVGVLYRLEIPLDQEEDIVAVKVKCPSTDRVYFLRVPPTMTTAQEAVAWGFNQNPEEYRPSHQT